MIPLAINLLLVVLILVCLLLGLVTMMQRPKQEGLGAAFGGDTMADLAGAKASDMLEKATGFLAVLFFAVAIALGILWNIENPTKAFVPEDAKEKEEMVDEEKEEESLPVDTTNDSDSSDSEVIDPTIDLNDDDAPSAAGDSSEESATQDVVTPEDGAIEDGATSSASEETVQSEGDSTEPALDDEQQKPVVPATSGQ